MRRIRYYINIIIAYIVPRKCYGYMQMASGDCENDYCNRCKLKYIESIKTKYRRS